MGAPCFNEPAPIWDWYALVARRPAVAAAVCFIAGILAHPIVPPRPAVWLIASALLIIVTGFCNWRFRLQAIATLCLAAAIFFVGLASAQLDAFFFPSNEIGLFTEQTERLAELEMRIVAPPTISDPSAEMRTLPPKQLLTTEVTAIHTRNGWIPAVGHLTVSVEPPNDTLIAGQTIRSLGFLSRPVPPANPGQRDFAAADRLNRELAEFRVRRSEGIQIIHDARLSPVNSPFIWMHQTAECLLAAGFPADRAVDASLLRMLVLGDTDAQVRDVKEEFAQTGTAYQLSISGLHIAIIGSTVLLILRLMQSRPKRGVWIAWCAVMLYAAVALPGTAGIRSLIMCGAGTVGLLGRRMTDGLQLLAVAVLAMLIIAPLDSYQAGFQIGVAAVLGLLLFARHVHLFISRLWTSPEPWAGRPVDHGVDAENKAILIAKSVAAIAWRTLLVSAIIWVTILPLVAYHFQQTNPWAVPGGVLLLPLSVVALLAGVLKIILTALCPPASHLLAISALPAALLRHGVDFLAQLPGAAVATAPPPIWTIVVYYLLLILPLFPWRSLVVRRVLRFAPVAACGTFLLLLTPAVGNGIGSGDTAIHVTALRTGGIRLSLLSIGAGQTALVRVAGGQTFFVDCGSTTIPDVFRRAIHPYLQHEGVRRVDEIFLSHGDYDHICAASEIIQTYNAPTVRMTPQFRPNATVSVPAEGLLHFLDTIGPAPTITYAGASIDVGGGASIQVLWPPANCAMNSNNCGMVLKLTYAGRSILFPADIQVPPEVELLKNPALLKSDVLIAPHHGSAESSTLAFIKAVNPRFILCSSDRMLTHKQLVFDSLAKPWPVYRTNDYGAIDVTIDSNGKLTMNTFTDAVAKSPNPDVAATALH